MSTSLRSFASCALLALLVVAPACKKKPSGVVLDIRTPGLDSLLLHFEVPGATDHPLGFMLAALPAPGTPIKMYLETSCGRRETTVPFPAAADLTQWTVDSGPTEGLAMAQMTVSKLGTIEVPVTTPVYIDPKLPPGTQVRFGTSVVHNAQKVALDCVDKVTVGDATFDLPPANSDHRRPSVLVTASADACFHDESKLYGDATTGEGTTILKGARVYVPSQSVYDFVFERPDAKVKVDAHISGTVRHALYEAPCP